MAEILQVNPDSPDSECIARAAFSIRAGHVVAIPTDTVYGLAADPFQTNAVERVFAAKGRPSDSPVLLLVDSMEMAVSLAKDLPESFPVLAKQFWPGPLTIVVEASEELPGVVTANTGRVGLRLPAAAIAQALLRAVGGPITGTSANRSGRPVCRSAAEVETSLGGVLPLILDGGPSTATIPSTVISLRKDSWQLLREGPITTAELESFFEKIKVPLMRSEAKNRTSG